MNNNLNASLSIEAKLSLYKKSQKSGISINILEEIYSRGYNSWCEDSKLTPEQLGFDRVNSFISGGFSFILDEDIVKNNPHLREIGTKTLTNIYKKDTPGMKEKKTASVVKRVVKSKGITKDIGGKMDGFEPIGSIEKIHRKRKIIKEGDVIKTKLATKQAARGIVGPHRPDAEVLSRAWFNRKTLPKSSEKSKYIAYHGKTARLMSDPSIGHHVDFENGAVQGDYDFGKVKAPVIRKQAKKKKGNVVQLKRDEK